MNVRASAISPYREGARGIRIGVFQLGGEVKYRPEIDGLRAVAVLPVMGFHAMPQVVKGGFLGVDVFFVISGYLITSIIVGELQQGRFSLLRFYERRARRILPALFVVVLATLPFAWAWMLPGQLEEYGGALIAVAGFFSNIHYWLQDGYFARASELKPLLHSWSLAVEEQYYLFFPLVLGVFWARERRLLVPALALGLLVSLAGAHMLAATHPRAAFFLLPGRAWELLAGALSGIWLLNRQEHRHNGAAAALGLGMILAAFALIDRHDRIPGLIVLLPVAGTVLLILFAGPQTLAGRLLSGRAMVAMGLISYSAYLWHQPIFAFARMRALGPIPPAGYLGLGLLSIALAWLTWRFVELPIRRGRAGGQGPRLARRPLFALAGLATLATMLLGAALSWPLLEPPRFRELRPISQQFEAMIAAREPWGRGNRCEVWPLSQWRTQWQGCDPYANGDAPQGSAGAPEGVGAGSEGIRTATRAGAPDRKLPETLLPVPIAVMGDSHATDLAIGLRLNGLDPFQATGAGCSIVPRNMSHNCRAFFDHALAAAARQTRLRTLWLAHRFRPDEMTPDALRETFQYWSESGLPIVFFTPRPEYPDRNDLILKARMFGGTVPQRPERSLSDISRHPHLPQIAAGFDMRIIDTEEEYCEFTGSCGFRSPAGTYLTYDYAHFTNFGARFFVGHVLREYMCDLSPAILAHLPADTDGQGHSGAVGQGADACRS